MDDDFSVAVGLENRAAMLEAAAPLGGVGEVAIVAQRNFAFVAVDHDGLGVEESFVARRGVTRVADGETSRKLREDAGLENFFDFAHGPVYVQLFAIAGNDARRFLTAMLQGVETEISEVCGFGVAEDTEDTTLVVKMIVCECELLIHFEANVRSSEWAQASRSVSTELSITARPLCSMRKEPSRVTWPIWCAATLYCLAVSRTAASLDGVTERTTRAPRSPKRTDSVGAAASLRLTFVPKAEKADSSLRRLRSE